MKMRLIFLLSRFDCSITFTEQSFSSFSILLSSFRICCEKTSYVLHCIEHLGLGSWTLLFFFVNDEQANSYVAISHHLIYQVSFFFILLTDMHTLTERDWMEREFS